MNRIALSLVFFALLLAPACQILGPDDQDAWETHAQRAIWEAYSSGTYSFTLERLCFCLYAGPFRVQVIDSEVHTAISELTTEPVPADYIHLMETVEDIFDLIDRAMEEAEELDVQYAEEGYPKRVSIDWVKPAVDDEIVIVVKDILPGVPDGN